MSRLDICPGEEKRILRKSAFRALELTENRTLAAGPHGKTHSAPGGSRKNAFCDRASRKDALCVTARIQNALFGDATTADCAFPLCYTCGLRFSVSRLDICPGEEKRILRKSAFRALELTENRTLAAGPHGKTHSAPGGSRKNAFCDRASRKDALCVTARIQNALFGDATTADCAFPLCYTCGLRFSVSRLDVCPGEEKRSLRKSALWLQALTERRTLCVGPHVEPHSSPWVSPKTDATQVERLEATR